MRSPALSVSLHRGRLPLAGLARKARCGGRRNWAWPSLRGLSYRDGALVVAQAGYYYIYSKVQLGGTGCSQGLTVACPSPTGALQAHRSATPGGGGAAGQPRRCGRSRRLPGVVGQQLPGRSGPPNVGDAGGGTYAGRARIQVHDGTRSYSGPSWCEGRGSGPIQPVPPTSKRPQRMPLDTEEHEWRFLERAWGTPKAGYRW